MRKVFAEELVKFAKGDDKVYLLVADMGSFNEFKKLFPKRFINVGIAEANQVSIAAGLASEGNKVFIYGVAGFSIHRGFEQLKFDIGHWAKNLVVVNAASGLCYNRCGAGHYLTDDFALMRALPNVHISAPCDRVEFRDLVNVAYKSKGMFYIRTGLDNCSDIKFQRYPYVQWREDNWVTVATTGVCTGWVAEACNGLPVDILHLRDLKTLYAGKFGGRHRVVVVEDHISFGGVRESFGKIFDHICLPDIVSETDETHQGLLRKYGFSIEQLRERIQRALVYEEH